MTEPIKVGIVGAGVIGQVHAQALQSVPNTKVIAIAEPRPDAGPEFATKHNAKLYPSYVEMLKNDDIEVIILGTPSGLHPEQAVLAAQAGKHIITEKPMAITADGATRMIDAAEKAGVHLAVIFQNRLSRDVFRARRAIDHGLIGKPLIGTAHVYWHRTQAYYDANGGWRGTWAMDGGGIMINQSIHMIDCLQWLMGGVKSIQSHTATLAHEIETEDVASASVAFNSGALGAILGTTGGAKDLPTRVEVIGTEGRFLLENNAITQWEGNGELSDDLLSDEDKHLVQDWAPNEGFGEGHARQLRLIFEALANGSEPPFPGRQARKAVDIILGIYESARTGQRVSIG